MKIMIQRGRKSKKVGGWEGLVRSWGASWDLWRVWARISREVGGGWAQDGRSWGQVGGKSRPRWAMMALRWAMMAPRWAMIALRWAMIASRWAMIAARWAF